MRKVFAILVLLSVCTFGVEAGERSDRWEVPAKERVVRKISKLLKLFRLQPFDDQITGPRP
jgi:hypothetical protein